MLILLLELVLLLFGIETVETHRDVPIGQSYTLYSRFLDFSNWNLSSKGHSSSVTTQTLHSKFTARLVLSPIGPSTGCQPGGHFAPIE